MQMFSRHPHRFEMQTVLDKLSRGHPAQASIGQRVALAAAFVEVSDEDSICKELIQSALVVQQDKVR